MNVSKFACFTLIFKDDYFYVPPFSMGAHIVSPLSVRTSVRPVRNTFGFQAISFERIGVLD